MRRQRMKVMIGLTARSSFQSTGTQARGKNLAPRQMRWMPIQQSTIKRGNGLGDFINHIASLFEWHGTQWTQGRTCSCLRISVSRLCFSADHKAWCFWWYYPDRRKFGTATVEEWCEYYAQNSASKIRLLFFKPRILSRLLMTVDHFF